MFQLIAKFETIIDNTLSIVIVHCTGIHNTHI